MAAPVETDRSPVAFKDQKAGLVIFGLLTILLGGFCALFVPLLFWSQSVADPRAAPQNIHVMVPAIEMYGVMAVGLIWLGIGSTMARRWARALLLIFSWNWLIVGTIPFAAMAFISSRVLKTEFEAIHDLAGSTGESVPPELAQLLIPVIAMLVLAVIFLIWPAVWVLFYRNRNVKATCEARDPVVRWTDRCPLPVIAACLWLALSVPTMLKMAVVDKGVVPVFGMFVAGPLGSALSVLGAVFWGYAAWAMYRLDSRGWWIVFVSLLLFGISAFLTYFRHDVTELYALMGYSQEQIAQMQKDSFLNGHTLAWGALLATAPFLGYLLYVRRFFPARS